MARPRPPARLRNAPAPPPAVPPLEWRGLAPVAAALAIAWGAVFAPQLIAGRVFVNGDWPRDIRFAESSAQHWRARHERALWNPYVFAGIPSAASLADPRPQYLPDVVLDALERLRDAPVLPPLRLPILAHLAGMIAAALLARALWGVGRSSMTWAGIAWGLLPNQLVPLAHGHHAQLVTVGLMPVSLLLVHGIFSAPLRAGALRRALGLALVIGLQIVAGHPQFAYYSMALAAAFALERARAFGRPARLMPALAAALLGVALAAASWWPMLHYGAESVRGRPEGVMLSEVARYSIGLRDLLVMAWPGAMGFGGAAYWGAMGGTDFPQYVTAMVALLALLAMARPRGDRATWLLGVAAVAAIVLALGVHLGPAYAALRAVIPFFAKLRVAVATLIVAQLALALLSARALERFISGPRRGGRGFAAAALVALLAGAALLAAGPAFESWWTAIAHAARGDVDGAALRAMAPHARLDLALRLAIVAAALLALAAACAGRRLGRVAGPALVGLLAIDLGSVTLPLMRGASAPHEQLRAGPPSELARRVSETPHTRGYADWFDALVRDNDWMVWRVPFLGGAHGTPPRLWNDLLNTRLIGVPAVQRSLAVSVVATPPGESLPGADYERATPAGAAPALWRLRGAMPRAFAVRHVIAPGNDIAVVAAMARTDSFPARVAFSEDERIAGEYPGSDSCSVHWLADDPDRVALACEAPGPAFLVIADAWFAGWTARVDDGEVPIHRVNYMTRAIVLPAGRHRVSMTYRPPGWATGVAVTRAATLIWGLLVLVMLLRRGPRTERPAAP